MVGRRGWSRGIRALLMLPALAVAGVAQATPPASSAAPLPLPSSVFGIPVPPLPSALPAGFPQLPYWSPQHVLVLPSAADPINTQLLAQLLGAKAAGAPGAHACGPNEVAPGEYVKLDCQPYAQVLGAAREVFDPAKLDLLARGLLHVSPQTAPPPAGGREGLPLEVDHRALGLEGPVKDQGLVGNCSAFSLSSVIDNAILRLRRSDVISPEHIWAHYGNGDMGSAGDSNLNKAIALNQTWPYSPKQACELVRDPNDECGQLLGVTPNSAASDATLQAQYRNAEQSGAYRITAIERVTQRPSVNIDAIAAVLATGADVWAGFDVDVASWKSTSHANNVIRDWATPNSGHAVALAGYRQAPGGGGKQFLVHNSWSGRWGDNGFAWLNEAMVRAHIQVAYKVTVVDPRGGRTGGQTDDECGAGSLVDGVTGACAPSCPGGARRLAGQCLLK